MSTSEKTTQSLQEVQARYVRLCLANNLDYTSSPESQMEVVSDDLVRKCIQRIVNDARTAAENKSLLARGRTAVLRKIYNELSDEGVAGFRDAFPFRLSSN